MKKGDKTVRVNSRAALEEPQFLVEHQGKIYLTLAVLEYDPSHPDMRPEQKEAIGALQGMLKDGETLRAVEYGGGGADASGDETMLASFSGSVGFSGANTGPPEDP